MRSTLTTSPFELLAVDLDRLMVECGARDEEESGSDVTQRLRHRLRELGSDLADEDLRALVLDWQCGVGSPLTTVVVEAPGAP